MDGDQNYFAHRAAAEWRAVAAATCDQARIVHAELARRYVDLANTSNIFMLRPAPNPAPDGSCAALATEIETAELQNSGALTPDRSNAR